jgi:hypothetical protein
MALKILNGIDVVGSMNITASDVPNLDAAKITSGTLSADRIPDLSAVYLTAGDYLDIDTANATFQPIGDYLISVPSEYLTIGDADGRYQPVGAYQPAGNYFTDGDSVINMNNNDGFVYDDTNNVMYVKLDGTQRALYHTGNFTDNSANWNTAYNWGNHASAGYLTSLPSHNHNTLYDAIGSAATVNTRIDEEIIPLINTFQPAGTYNTIIGTDSDINTSGATIIDNIYVTDGVITSMGTRTLTPADIGAATSSHNHNTLYDALGAADAVAQQVNERIDGEVFDAIGTKADASHTHSYLPLGGGTVTGNVVMSNTNPMISFVPSGANDGAGIRFNYTNNDGVFEFWTSDDYSEPFVWRAYDIGLAGTGTYQEWMKLQSNSLYVGGNKMATEAYVTSRGYLTSIPSTYATDAELATVANDLNTRIDTEVIPNIPTNNNQLTNGAGYITDGNTNWNNTYGFITSSALTGYATTSYVDTAVAGLVDTAPTALNTLNELAAALGDDANFSTTVANNIGAVNERIDNEVLPIVNSKLDSSVNPIKAASVSNDTITFTRADNTTFSVTTSDANTWRGIHDTPVDGATTTSISSNWAFDNVKTPVPAGAVFTDTNTNNYVSSVSFSTTNGVLTLNRSGLGALTVDLDGRYAYTSHTHNYLAPNTDIVVRGISARTIIPETPDIYDLGTPEQRWNFVFCRVLDSAGLHERNLANEETETRIGDYETGTVLIWSGGVQVPCNVDESHMRMGIAVKDVDTPLVQGAEPVLCTGAVNEGDYLVTSSTTGHAKAVSRDYVKQNMLFDCVLGKALESGTGESHLIKTWVNI